VEHLKVEMDLSALLIVGALLVIVIVAVAMATRSRAPIDLGSVSTSWTAQHNAGDRGGDRSRG
jgi:hypothetical protein